MVRSCTCSITWGSQQQRLGRTYILIFQDRYLFGPFLGIGISKSPMSSFILWVSVCTMVPSCSQSSFWRTKIWSPCNTRTGPKEKVNFDTITIYIYFFTFAFTPLSRMTYRHALKFLSINTSDTRSVGQGLRILSV